MIHIVTLKYTTYWHSRNFILETFVNNRTDLFTSRHLSGTTEREINDTIRYYKNSAYLAGHFWFCNRSSIIAVTPTHRIALALHPWHWPNYNNCENICLWLRSEPFKLSSNRVLVVKKVHKQYQENNMHILLTCERYENKLMQKLVPIKATIRK